jgi:hypothetical protein
MATFARIRTPDNLNSGHLLDQDYSKLGHKKATENYPSINVDEKSSTLNVSLKQETSVLEKNQPQNASESSKKEVKIP